MQRRGPESIKKFEITSKVLLEDLTKVTFEQRSEQHERQLGVGGQNNVSDVDIATAKAGDRNLPGLFQLSKERGLCC